MSQTRPLEHIIKTTHAAPATHCVIWLHGLGANYHDFENIIPLLQLSQETPYQFVFPNAPYRPVTINGGHHCRAWYDIQNLDRHFKEDDPGIHESEAAIIQLIEEQLHKGIPANRIFLAGFSQGGAMALFTGIRYPQPLGGIIALSCYLPLLQWFHQHPLSNSTPILQCHGRLDNVVPFNFGKLTQQFLQQHYNLQFKQYEIAHQVSNQELADIGEWLTEQGKSTASLDTLPA